MENESNSVSNTSSDCKLLISLLYYSKLLQGIYLLGSLSCTAMILLRFLIEENLTISQITVIIQLSTCSLFLLEQIIRLYIQGLSNFCTLTNIFDFLIISLCTINSVLSLQTKVLESLGNNTCDTLLVIRNLIYLIKFLFTHQEQSQDKLNKLKIVLNLREEEEELTIRNKILEKTSKPADDEIKKDDSAWNIIKSASG